MIKGIESCKFYIKKYITVLSQITNTEIFVIIAALVFKLFYNKVLFTNKKDDKNC